jgi:hypothetical protein
VKNKFERIVQQVLNLADCSTCNLSLQVLKLCNRPRQKIVSFINYLVFGWEFGWVGTKRTRSRSCLDGDEEGWVGFRGEYSAQMLVHSHP